jgi:dual oxidase
MYVLAESKTILHYCSVKMIFPEIGNPRGNENPFLLTFGILWFRYHNFRARQLKANHPDWSDEKLFNEARKWVIAVHQVITVKISK